MQIRWESNGSSKEVYTNRLACTDRYFQANFLPTVCGWLSFAKLENFFFGSLTSTILHWHESTTWITLWSRNSWELCNIIIPLLNHYEMWDSHTLTESDRKYENTWALTSLPGHPLFFSILATKTFQHSLQTMVWRHAMMSQHLMVSWDFVTSQCDIG